MSRFVPMSRCRRQYSKRQTTKQYSEAFAKLEADDVTAMPAFAALVGQHADDALAGFHLRRLLNGGKGVRMQLE